MKQKTQFTYPLVNTNVIPAKHICDLYVSLIYETGLMYKDVFEISILKITHFAKGEGFGSDINELLQFVNPDLHQQIYEAAENQVVSQFKKNHNVFGSKILSCVSPLILLNVFTFQNSLLVLILLSVVYLIFINTRLFAKPQNRHYMNITIRILTEDLSTPQLNTIREALGTSSKAELTKALEKISKAAFLEYCQMISGSGTPAKIDEIRMERLFLLVQHYFQDRFPNENEVENIFHLGNKSKGLLQNTISHYKTQLPYFNQWLWGYLKKATPIDSGHQFECTSPTIILQLNAIVRKNWASHELITKIPKTASTYQCSDDTYDKLKKFLTNV